MNPPEEILRFEGINFQAKGALGWLWSPKADRSGDPLVYECGRCKLLTADPQGHALVERQRATSAKMLAQVNAWVVHVRAEMARITPGAYKPLEPRISRTNGAS